MTFKECMLDRVIFAAHNTFLTIRHPKSCKFFISDWYPVQQLELLYSWRFSRYNAPIHWPVHGHMTSNNETVSRQTPWAGNIAKIMTSTGKQFTVTREMLTTVALIVFHRLDSFLLYNKSLNAWSLGEQWIFFPSNLPEISPRISLRFSGSKIHCSPRDQSLSV